MIDGETLRLKGSNAINRYVGKLTDLYPADAWQAALCDEVMEAVEDINTKLAATFFLPEEEKKTQRKALVEGPLPFYLARPTAAARSTWRPLLRCGPSNSRGSQGLRVDPAP